MITVSGVSVSMKDAVLLPRTDLHVGRGESVAVSGVNGAGKTTLLRVIAGLLTPTTGTVTVAGRTAARRDRGLRRRVAGALDPAPLDRNLTVREQLVLIGTTWGCGIDGAAQAADTVCESLGIAALGARFPHELSSGQRQLVQLAVTLVRPFDVLLLDEPEQRLDADRTGVVERALTAVHARGATVVLATHSDRMADVVCDREVRLVPA